MAARAHEAERLGVPFLGEVPLAMTIRETSDAGRPIVASDPDSPHAKAYLAIARQVLAGLTGATRAAPRSSSSRRKAPGHHAAGPARRFREGPVSSQAHQHVSEGRPVITLLVRPVAFARDRC